MPVKAKKKAKFFAEGSYDMLFFIIVMVVLSIGLVMLFSASYPYAYYKYGNSSHFFLRQLVFAVIGVAAMLMISKVDHHHFKKFAIAGLAVSIALLIIVLLLPPVRPGFRRWIIIPFTKDQTFQPSEIAKLALILFFAWNFDREYTNITGRELSKGRYSKKIMRASNGRIIIKQAFFPTVFNGAVIIFIAGLVALENHLSGTILMLGISAVMFYLGGFKNYWFAIIGILAVIVIILLVTNPDFLPSYAKERITAWKDKDFEPKGARWQINQGLYAIGSGGFFGQGLGKSMQKYMYVSEPQNDMIFSIVCEELGFVGATIIIVLYAVLVWRGVVIGLHARDKFGALLAMGMVFQVGLQTVMNIAVATDSVPNTGISLPFFSYGGTSLMILLFQMGMVLSVSRSSRLNKQ
ncbi:MAG: putative lipid II flippase FtsW [Oscillospiraceae bacterium]|nr:putative lipid II flippase FtsW [Oscillospiraceae bacterium]